MLGETQHHSQYIIRFSIFSVDKSISIFNTVNLDNHFNKLYNLLHTFIELNIMYFKYIGSTYSLFKTLPQFTSLIWI